ncbi:unnamed protein product [Prorocentrum cordatum]|uniref:Uncharacterized protein n=1 Tax=Prorocentrum cordatum TaxID=2364126 RepID=A0ABN9U493_9DINO|nr:unnamed protein product [Polarella glacialis]
MAKAKSTKAQKAEQKAAKAAQQKKRQAKKAANLPLMETVDDDDSPEKRARAERARSEQDKFNKCINDNFEGWTEEDLTMVFVDGLNVIQKVKADKEAKKAGEAIAFGKKYFADVREKWQNPNGSLAQLEPDDDTLAIDVQLEQALTNLIKSKKDAAEWFRWCEEVQEVDDLNFCACFRQCLKWPAFRSLENASISIAAFRMAKRLGLDKKLVRKWPLLLTQLDRAAHRQLLSYKSQGKTNNFWWQCNKDWADLLLPEAETSKAMEEKKAWSNVKEEMMKVADSCETGSVLFAKPLRQLEVDRGAVFVATHVEHLAGEKAINAAALNKHKREFEAACKSAGIDVSKPFTRPKLVDVTYRSRRLQVQAGSTMDHFRMAQEALIRTIAVDNDLIPSVWCENELVGQRAKTGHTIVQSVLGTPKNSRKALDEFVNPDELSAATITKCLKAKSTFLKSLDRFISIDIAFWWSCVGESAKDAVEEAILECLPREGARPTIDQSIANLKRLADSKLGSFMGTGLQTFLQAVTGWVKSLKMNSPPKIDQVPSTTFTAKVEDALAQWYEAKPSGGGAVSEPKRGKAAAREVWSELSEKNAKEEAIPYDAVSPFKGFSFLLEPAERSKVKPLLDKAGAAGGHAAIAAAPGGPEGKKKRKHVEAHDVTGEVAALFKKSK